MVEILMYSTQPIILFMITTGGWTVWKPWPSLCSQKPNYSSPWSSQSL